jgi:hypothetical protein
MKRLLGIFCAWVVLLAGARAQEAKPLWLACGPAELLKPLEPLAALRRSQGMEALLVPKMPKEALAAAPRRPDFLVIVGDDDAKAPAGAAWEMPTAHVPFHRWNAKQKADFPSDFGIAGLDARGLPRMAVGRLPVRTADEAARVAGKILAWESEKPTRASLALPMWAGDPIYDPSFTRMFMGFLFGQIEKNAPPWLEPWIVSGDQQHALCGWPQGQAQAFNERTGQGALFTGMIGHGNTGIFCGVLREGKWIGAYRNADTAGLAAGPVRPPQVIFACECGVFDLAGGKRCLAEELLLAPAGPVLTVAATNESHPLVNFYSATNLLRLVGSNDGPVAFGTLWLETQRAMRRRTDLVMELLLKGVEGSYSGPTDAQELKQDQGSLYAIFGDPATRLHTPRRLTVKVTKNGAGWAWEATPPMGAPAGVKLTVERRAVRPDFPDRPENADEAASRAMFEKANAALAFQPVPSAGWSGELKEPGFVRFLVEAGGEIWVAGAELKE